MGDAKRRQTRLQRMLAAQPWCVYCGGKTPGDSIDHMPPITMFENKQRLAGLEFVACEGCHEGTRPLDQVAGFLSRVDANGATSGALQELRTMFSGVRNNYDDVVREMMPTPDQLDRARRMGGFAAFNIGDKTHTMMQRFGARAAMALHYHRCSEIIPEAGGVFVRWFTNERLVKGDFPSDFTDTLPPPQSLRQGSKSQDAQFVFSSSATTDKRISQHQITFRTSLAFQSFAARDVRDLDRLAGKFAHMIFRPGFLKEHP